MAVLRTSPLLPQALSPSSTSSSQYRRRPTFRRVTGAAAPAPLPPPSRGIKTGFHGGAKKSVRLLARRRSGGVEAVPCLPTKEDVVGVAGGGGDEEEADEYLVRESGWGVRRMGRVSDEMRRVALVQAEAFHVPVALFNDFFFDFFKVY